MNKDILSSRQAYVAMLIFLERYYEMTQADEIGALLGSMQLLDDGVPADRALLNDWEGAVKASLSQSG